MRRLTAVVVAIGIAAAVNGVIGRAEGSPATGGVSNRAALTQASAGDVGDRAPLAPPVAWKVAPSAGIEEPGWPLDLATLKRELRETSAIGFLAKLKLRHDVRQLIEDFQRYHGGDDSVGLEVLGERFDRLLRGVVTLLRGDDSALAERIAAARGALWDLLADPDGARRRTVGL